MLMLNIPLQAAQEVLFTDNILLRENPEKGYKVSDWTYISRYCFNFKMKMSHTSHFSVAKSLVLKVNYML